MTTNDKEAWDADQNRMVSKAKRDLAEERFSEMHKDEKEMCYRQLLYEAETMLNEMMEFSYCLKTSDNNFQQRIESWKESKDNV